MLRWPGSMRGSRKSCGWTGAPCFACLARSPFPAVWSSAKAKSHSIHQRLGWVRKQGMVDRLHHKVWKYDLEGVRCCLDMLEGETSNAEEEENVRKLRAYLERNWECLTPLAMRKGLEECQKGLGTCESNHRTYTYRMKKQGRRWSKKGGLAMVKVISGLKAGAKVRPCRADLASGLAGTLYEYTLILRESGGQAQEESAGQHRVLSLLGWSTRAIGSGFPGP